MWKYDKKNFEQKLQRKLGFFLHFPEMEKKFLSSVHATEIEKKKHESVLLMDTCCLPVWGT